MRAPLGVCPGNRGVVPVQARLFKPCSAHRSRPSREFPLGLRGNAIAWMIQYHWIAGIQISVGGKSFLQAQRSAEGSSIEPRYAFSWIIGCTIAFDSVGPATRRRKGRRIAAHDRHELKLRHLG